ncbi:hypothetical protein [Rhodohalobacter sp.]|uniref:hypothetical protein n=1 Tax=Rhodohalobacter sp. TaxID=1974210 RepID=UPI002ACE1ED0|nr:hypothetical protein [Rhodohalobacter sp.]MDZ7757763.1 hypothetical protein [Rhodohalobacter sp.]
MITKEKVKKEIDKLSDTDVEKVYSYLSSLRKTKKTEPNIRSLKLKGKLDEENLRDSANSSA